MSLHAYRFFSNDCRPAMEFYRDVFGGTVDMMTFADMPPGEDGAGDVDPSLVMHAALTFPDGSMLMASDDPSGDGGPVKGIAIHHSAADVDDGQRIFDRLADGGEVTMSFGEVFWAQRFGMCTDRFGTSWMISVDHPATAG
jgi:PhnB protein